MRMNNFSSRGLTAANVNKQLLISTVVGIDFDRRYRDRNTRGGGVKFSKPTTTPSVVLVNAKGELQERFVASDKGDPMRKSVADRVFKPSR